MPDVRGHRRGENEGEDFPAAYPGHSVPALRVTRYRPIERASDANLPGAARGLRQ